ncbi:MAG: RING finger protein [Candidatus Heimdallarchaeaceae archaeon]
MARVFPAIKILIFSYALSLVVNVLTAGYKETRGFYPLFILLFIIPVTIICLVIIEWIFKIIEKWLKKKRFKIAYSPVELVFAIVLQGLFSFGLVFAWSNYLIFDGIDKLVFSLTTIFPTSFFIIYSVFWFRKREKKIVEDKLEIIIKKASRMESKKKPVTEYDFESKVLIPGFTSEHITEQDKLSITYDVPTKHRYFDVISKLKIEYIDYLKALKLTMKLQSDSLLSLNIQRRDSAFGHLKDELVIPRLANVYVLHSSTPEVWGNLFNDNFFRQSLLLLRPHLEQFSLKGQYVEVVIYSEKAILKVLDWVLDLNPSMEKLSGSLEVTRAEKMLCYNCQDPFDPFEEVCTSCGSPRPRCIVCFQDLKPEIDTDVVILPCCKIYAHKDHMIVWLRKKPSCPNCHADLSRWINKIGI